MAYYTFTFPDGKMGSWGEIEASEDVRFSFKNGSEWVYYVIDEGVMYPVQNIQNDGMTVEEFNAFIKTFGWGWMMPYGDNPYEIRCTLPSGESFSGNIYIKYLQ